MKTLFTGLIIIMLWLANTTQAEGFYVQAEGAHNTAEFSDFKYFNPELTRVTRILISQGVRSGWSAINGDYVDFHSPNLQDSSTNTNFKLGYQFDQGLNLNLALRLVGKFSASGRTKHANIEREHELTTDLMMLGLAVGYQYHLTKDVYLMPYIEPAIANIKLESRSRIILADEVFCVNPSKTQSRSVVGLGFNFGHRLPNGLDLVGGYYSIDLGKMDASPPIPICNWTVTEDEHYKAKLRFSAVSFGVRYNF